MSKVRALNEADGDSPRAVICESKYSIDLSQAAVGSVEAVTAKQLEVLVAIERLTAVRGAPPPLSDLAAEVGLSSVATVSAHLERLQAKGYIHRDAGAHYGLTVLIPSSRAVIKADRPTVKKAPLRSASTEELEAELRRRGRRVG